MCLKEEICSNSCLRVCWWQRFLWPGPQTKTQALCPALSPKILFHFFAFPFGFQQKGFLSVLVVLRWGFPGFGKKYRNQKYCKLSLRWACNEMYKKKNGRQKIYYSFLGFACAMHFESAFFLCAAHKIILCKRISLLWCLPQEDHLTYPCQQENRIVEDS